MSRRHTRTTSSPQRPSGAPTPPRAARRRRPRAGEPAVTPPTCPSGSRSTACWRSWPPNAAACRRQCAGARHRAGDRDLDLDDRARGRHDLPVVRGPHPEATSAACRTSSVSSASAVHGRVEIESSAPVPAASLEKAINAAGYEIGRTPWLASDPAVWLTAVAGVALVAALAVLAQVTGLADLASGAGDLSQGGLVVALLLGLAAGVSTCMALVGGLVLALSASFQARPDGPGDPRMAGSSRRCGRRSCSWPAGSSATPSSGPRSGAVGASVTMPPQVTAVLMIAVAIVMTILGTRLTGLSPRIATWSPTLPMGLGRQLGLGDGAGRAPVLGRAGGGPRRGLVLPALRLHPGRPDLRALDGVAALSPARSWRSSRSGPRPGCSRWPGSRSWCRARCARPSSASSASSSSASPSSTRAPGIRLSGVTLPSFGVETAAAAPPAGDRRGGRRDAGAHDLPGRAAGTARATCRSTRASRRAGRSSRRRRAPAPPSSSSRSSASRSACTKGSNTIDLPALQPGTAGLLLLDGDVRRAHHDRGAPDRRERRERRRRLIQPLIATASVDDTRHDTPWEYTETLRTWGATSAR